MTKNIFISFDVDGTLILFDTIKEHLEAFKDAISEIIKPCGYPADVLGHDIIGWMDVLIIHDVVAKLGTEPTPEIIRKIEIRMEELYQQRFNEVASVPPGMERLLKQLVSMPNVKIGLASGNLPGIAWTKLEKGNILKYFPDRIGGFGIGDTRERRQAVANAKKNAEEKFGIKFDKAIHIGDMPADVQAAIDNGIIAVGVRTGMKKDLEYPKPSFIFNNIDESFDDFMKLLE